MRAMVKASTGTDAHARLLATVRRIPRGRVASYGQVARLAGMPGHARMAGYALHGCPDPSVPWHRVINAQGRIPLPEADGQAAFQRALLEAEGVRFVRGRVDLERFGWKPAGAGSKSQPKRTPPPRKGAWR